MLRGCRILTDAKKLLTNPQSSQTFNDLLNHESQLYRLHPLLNILLNSAARYRREYSFGFDIGLLAVLGAAGQVVRPDGQHVSHSVPDVSVFGGGGGRSSAGRGGGVRPAGRLCDSCRGRLREAGACARGGHSVSKPRDDPRVE